MKNKHLERRLIKERVQDGFILPEVYDKYRKMVDSSFPNLSEEERDAETRVICHTHPDSPHVQKPAPDPKAQPSKSTQNERLIAALVAGLLIVGQIVALLLAVLIYLVLFSDKAHAAGGTSQIDVIKATDGTHTVVAAAPFKMTFSGCTVGGTGSAWTITCAGSAANPGGAAHQVQVNSAGTAFAGIALGTAGQVLESNGAGADPGFADPIVSGPDAVAATPTKNPVQIGCLFLTTPATLTNNQVGALQCDNGQNLLVKVSNFPSAFQANAGTNLNTSLLALESGGNLASIKADVDKIPASPATEGGNLASIKTDVDTLGTKTDAKSTATDSTSISIMQVLKEISAMMQAPASTPVTGAFFQGTQPVSIADGSSTTLGAKADAKSSATDTTAITEMQVLKEMSFLLQNALTVSQATGTNLHMVCDSGCSSSAGFADSAAFTAGTTAINPVGGLFDDTPPTAITTGHAAGARITPNRAVHINLRNQSGTEIGTASNPVRTDPTGTTTQPVSAASLPLPTGAAADSSLTTLDTDVKSNVTLHAGTNLIGKAGFDNTTPGTTNGVSMAQPTRTTGTITTSSTNIPVTSTGYGVATVTVNGTYAGITVNFEFSDDGGTTYYSDTCTRTDTNVQESSEALPSNQSRAWDCGVFAATNFRVRSSAFTSGTANIGITLSAASIEPAQTVSINGTVPVSAASLPLPTGAAADSSLSTIDTDIKADPCGPGHAKSYAFYDAATNGATQLVALSSGKIVYACSYAMTSAATTANTIKLVYGTGTNCATGQTAITPGHILLAGSTASPVGFVMPDSHGLQTIASNELCVLTNAAQAAQVEVSYVQQ